MFRFSIPLGWALLALLAAPPGHGQSPLRVGIDLDGNGLPDLWEARYAVAVGDLSSDSDGDGESLLEESRAGTDPESAASVLRFDGVDRSSDRLGITFSWNALPTKDYVVRFSDDLASWNDATDETVALAEVPSTLTYFRVEPFDRDADGDGLTAYEESLLGLADSDPTSHGGIASDWAHAYALATSPGSYLLDGVTVAGTPPAPGESARFLTQASLGADWELIQSVASSGPSAWLDAQLALPGSSHLERNLELLILDSAEGFPFSPKEWTWWDINMKAPDLLRQRVAFALSEIFVVSDRVEPLDGFGWSMANYYDILVDGAFDNFRETLYRVSRSPVMGIYLTHVKNRRADPSTNRFPDENYAREVMQLFSIGLFELNQDGSAKRDSSGALISTYSNVEITEFARVFTGMTFDPAAVPGVPYFGNPGENATIENDDDFLAVSWDFRDRPMFQYEPMHDTGAKQLLSYTDLNGQAVSGALPAGNTIEQDLQAAIDNLFQHPNVGPFIGRLLIQRLVTSNPSPDYIARVAAVFHDNGAGVRGDMRAVVRTILLDPEARNPAFIDDPTHGMLREPYVRYVHLCRALNAVTTSGDVRNEGATARAVTQQSPLGAPSVFNFFLPDYAPFGPVADAGLVAPEFQITTATTTVALHNFWRNAIVQGAFFDIDLNQPVNSGESWTVDITDELALAGDTAALLDRLDVLLTYGTMSTATRATLTTAIDSARTAGASDLAIVQLALFSILNAPDFAVLR